MLTSDDVFVFVIMMWMWLGIYAVTKQFEMKDNIHLHDTVYGLIHGISATIISILCLIDPSPILIKILTFNSVWYYVFNSVFFEQSIMFIGHHIAAIICYSLLYSTDYGFTVIPILIFIAEITNPLQNIICILSELRSQRLYFAQLIKIQIVSILIVRNIIGPWYMYGIILQMLNISLYLTCFICSLIIFGIIIGTNMWAYKLTLHYYQVSRCQVLIRHI